MRISDVRTNQVADQRHRQRAEIADRLVSDVLEIDADEGLEGELLVFDRT